jgi:hypothetical protein
MMIAVIMMFGFVLGIACVIYGGFAIRRGDVDRGKMSIIGGAIIAAAPAVIYAFHKIFALTATAASASATSDRAKICPDPTTNPFLFIANICQCYC